VTTNPFLTFCTSLYFALFAITATASNTPQPPLDAFPIPDHYLLINDFLGVFQVSQSIQITKKLQDLEKINGTQIVFLSVPSIGNEGIDAYAIKVAEKWDIGNNGQGNGVLFLVSENDGMYILTGPGIAGALPDVKIARIFREIIEPYWGRGEYSKGAEAAIDALIKGAKGEDNSPTFYDYAHPITSLKTEHLLIGLLMVFALVYAGALIWLRRKKRVRPAP